MTTPPSLRDRPVLLATIGVISLIVIAALGRRLIQNGSIFNVTIEPLSSGGTVILQNQESIKIIKNFIEELGCDPKTLDKLVCVYDHNIRLTGGKQTVYFDPQSSGAGLIYQKQQEIHTGETPAGFLYMIKPSDYFDIDNLKAQYVVKYIFAKDEEQTEPLTNTAYNVTLLFRPENDYMSERDLYCLLVKDGKITFSTHKALSGGGDKVDCEKAKTALKYAFDKKKAFN